MGKTNKPKTQKGKHAGGRPTIMTKEVLAKLEQAFGYGASDSEACFYAGISKDALYDYCNKFPEFSNRKEQLKERPILKARQTIVNSLDNPESAKWYLERKKKAEFSQRQEVTGEDGKPIAFSVNHILNEIDGRTTSLSEIKGETIE